MTLRVSTTVAPSLSGAFVLGDMQGSLLRQTGLGEIVSRVCEWTAFCCGLSMILRASAKRRRRRELARFKHDRREGA